MPSTSPDISVGTLIDGKYRVERHIGEGGMGYVVAARHETLGELYAVKLLVDADDETLRKRFMREARAAARITSAHIAKVFDVGEMHGGAVYMVMELLEGEDLDDRLVKQGPLAIDEAVGYLIQACEALSEAHGLGIVHRDIKPGNLFLAKTPSGRRMVKLLDFGISKDSVPGAQPVTKLTDVGDVLGSPLYLAPEQLVSSSDVDARADIWSLGVTLFELLTGKGAFDGATMTDLYTAILRHDPRKLSDLRHDVPAKIEEVIERCLQKDPFDRYETVGELVHALAPFAPANTQDSIARITKNVAPVAATISADELEATLKRDAQKPLAETLGVPLVRRKAPSLSTAQTTVMERERQPAALASTLDEPGPPRSASWPPPPPTPLEAAPRRARRWPLVLLVVLSLAVLVAGGYRYASQQGRIAMQPTKKSSKKGKKKKKKKAGEKGKRPKSGGERGGAPESKPALTPDTVKRLKERLDHGAKYLPVSSWLTAEKAAADVLDELDRAGFVRGVHTSVLGARAEALLADTYVLRVKHAYPGAPPDMSVGAALTKFAQGYDRAEAWDENGELCAAHLRAERLVELANRVEQDDAKVAEAYYRLIHDHASEALAKLPNGHCEKSMQAWIEVVRARKSARNSP